MINKKIVIISPNFFPMKDGLGGHTKELSLELEKKFQSVYIITSYDMKLHADHLNTTIFPHIKKWNLYGFLQVFKLITKIRPNIVFIQYLPFLYAKKGGINFWIILFFVALRYLTPAQIHLYCHELFYPFECKLKSIVMHFSHKIMLYGIAINSDIILTTTKRFQNYLQKIFFYKKIHHLPIGSNINTISITEHEIDEFKKKHLIDITKKWFVLFGMPHPSKNYQAIVDIFCLNHIKNHAGLILVGTSAEELDKSNIKNFTAQNILILGKLEDKEINIVFSFCHFMISYFSDGISTRRGSALAALSMGLPLITTWSKNSEKIFLNQSFIELLPTDQKEFSDALIQFIQKKQTKNYCKSDILNFSKKHFYWETIIKDYLYIVYAKEK